MEALLAPSFDTGGDVKSAGLMQNNVPGWGSYLYQNYVLPALSPNLGLSLSTDWLSNGNGNSTASAPAINNDYFSTSAPWSAQLEQNNVSAQAQQASAQLSLGQPGPSNYYLNYYGGASIAPSLLAPQQQQQQQQQQQIINAINTNSNAPSSNISPTLDITDKLVGSPSPLDSSNASPFMHSARGLSVDSDADAEHDVDLEAAAEHSHSEHEHDHDHDEGVERDGMIWGMKVESYRALSARERKRVRNRISARTFRAKRKEHLNSLEHTLGAKDLQIKIAHDETARLKREVAELKRRLAKYEKPYERP